MVDSLVVLVPKNDTKNLTWRIYYSGHFERILRVCLHTTASKRPVLLRRLSLAKRVEESHPKRHKTAAEKKGLESDFWGRRRRRRRRAEKNRRRRRDDCDPKEEYDDDDIHSPMRRRRRRRDLPGFESRGASRRREPARREV